MPDDLNDQNLSELASSISAHDLNSMSQALTVSVLNSALDINTANNNANTVPNSASNNAAAFRSAVAAATAAAAASVGVAQGPRMQQVNGLPGVSGVQQQQQLPAGVRPGQPLTFPILQGQLLQGQLVTAATGGPLVQGPGITPVTAQRAATESSHYWPAETAPTGASHCGPEATPTGASHRPVKDHPHRGLPLLVRDSPHKGLPLPPRGLSYRGLPMQSCRAQWFTQSVVAMRLANNNSNKALPLLVEVPSKPSPRPSFLRLRQTSELPLVEGLCRICCSPRRSWRPHPCTNTDRTSCRAAA